MASQDKKFEPKRVDDAEVGYILNGWWPVETEEKIVWTKNYRPDLTRRGSISMTLCGGYICVNVEMALIDQKTEELINVVEIFMGEWGTITKITKNIDTSEELLWYKLTFKWGKCEQVTYLNEESIVKLTRDWLTTRSEGVVYSGDLERIEFLKKEYENK